MFIENCWYVVAWVNDIAQDQLFAISIIGKPVVLYRGTDSKLIALENRCCHRAALLGP
jgi:phenylpropionate dioxygenase-like ring-hydroxylating dioxygenase large terminal subunit